MKVSNMINSRGNVIANQFIIESKGLVTFQSYKTTIAKVRGRNIILDSNALDYSRTTSKHLYNFLGMNRKQIEEAIERKEIKVKDLN